MDGDELQRLMMAYQAGSLEAFERIYTSLAAPVLGYLTALCRERAHAEDLLQESFLQVHRSRHTYRARPAAAPVGIRNCPSRLAHGSPDALAAPADGIRAAGAAGARRRRASRRSRRVAPRARRDPAGSPRSTAPPSRLGIQLCRDRSAARYSRGCRQAAIESGHGRSPEHPETIMTLRSLTRVRRYGDR